MAIRATVRAVERVDDEGTPLQFVTLAVGDAAFTARDTRALVDPDWVDTERDVVVMAFFPEITAQDGDDDDHRDGDVHAESASDEPTAGIDASAEQVSFTGTVTDVQAGEEGFVATLDVGDGTVRFDPGAAPDVRPGDRATVTTETVHVVAVED